MTHRSIFFSLALSLAVSAAFGCSKKESATESASTTESAGAAESTSAAESAGAGESAGAKSASVDSKLLGVYKVERYQQSQGACDQLADVSDAPSYVVLYAFHPSSKPEESRLGGTFCADVHNCRAMSTHAPEPMVGYSFIEGDDSSGWQGWAITGTGPEEDMCAADVQSHSLVSTKGQSIRIETRTVRALFLPVVEDKNAICHNRDAIAAASKEDLACKSLLVLEATLEQGL